MEDSRSENFIDVLQLLFPVWVLLVLIGFFGYKCIEKQSEVKEDVVEVLGVDDGLTSFPVNIYYNYYDITDGLMTKTSGNHLAGTGKVEYKKSVIITGETYPSKYFVGNVSCNSAEISVNGNKYTIKHTGNTNGGITCHVNLYNNK